MRSGPSGVLPGLKAVPEKTMMREIVDCRINGNPTKLEVEGDRMLLWVLRTDLELTGTKFGCGASLCGAQPA